MIAFQATILWSLVGLTAIVGVDFILGVLSSLRAGTFTVTYLWHQLEAQGIPLAALLVIGLLQAASVNGASLASGPLAGIFYTFSAAYALRLLSDILSKLTLILGPIPAAPGGAATAVTLSPAARTPRT